MQSLKDLTLMLSKKKQMLKFFSYQEICQLSPLNMCKKSKEVVYSWSTWPNKTIIQSFNSKFSVKLFDTLWPLNTIKVTESGMNRQSLISTTTTQSLTFTIVIVSKKIAMLKF